MKGRINFLSRLRNAKSNPWTPALILDVTALTYAERFFPSSPDICLANRDELLDIYLFVSQTHVCMYKEYVNYAFKNPTHMC